MKHFNIFGTIVDSNIEKETPDDITLSDVSTFLDEVDDNDEITFVINSCGGSVTTGIAIANKIKALSKRGIKTTAKIEGLCASIATVIMCACDKIIINSSSFIMIHNCWSIVQGDANTLRKEAETMDKMNKAILSFYRSKFGLTDEELQDYMDKETWFSGSEVNDFKLSCEVIDVDDEIKLCASIKKYHFKNLPKGLITMEEEKKVIEEENVENISKAVEEIEETKVEETKEEEKEPTIEELKAKIAELEEKLKEYEEPTEEKTVTEEECNKRVAGMQSTMQAKINDFTKQLKVRDEELAKYKNEAINLKSKLDQSEKELSEMASAFEEKKNALAQLNASVNTPKETTDWRNLNGKQFFDYLKKNNIH